MHLVRIHACVTENIAQPLSRVTLQEVQLQSSHPVDSSVRVYKDLSYIKIFQLTIQLESNHPVCNTALESRTV